MDYTAVVDLRSYHPRERLAWIDMTLSHLGRDEDMIIILEHEPEHLAARLAERHTASLIVEEIEAGPEVWRYRIAYHRAPD